MYFSCFYRLKVFIYIRKVLRCGIGVYIGKLRSAAIVYEPDFISVWFWDSPKGTNDSRLHVCYYVIAFANFLADLVFYFVSYIACGRRFVVVSFRRFQNAIARNNFKAVCESVNDKVPVTVGFEVVYPGLSVKWGFDHGLWVY